MRRGFRYHGHNEAATRDVIDRLHDFLERTLTSSDR
jgi:hypothetical protein